MSAVPVVRIEPCERHQCPGHAFVEINESDFDPKMGHVLYDPFAEKDDDAGFKKMPIGELRQALTHANVAFPEGAKKAELQALFDALPAA